MWLQSLSLLWNYRRIHILLRNTCFFIDTERLLHKHENDDTVGVLENLEHDIGAVICNQKDDSDGIVENHENFPFLKKQDKVMMKLVARKIFKAISGRMKFRAKKKIDYGISNSSRTTNLELFRNGRILSTKSYLSLLRSSLPEKHKSASFHLI